MKSLKHVLSITLMLVFTLGIFAQEEKKEEPKPYYLTITTAHWNMEADGDFSDWLEVEKEYFEKVTMKNELISGSGVYTHYYTPDNSEVILVNVYKTWNDIEASNDVTQKLIEEGWPDEEARKAFFAKQQGYYSKEHSDEIYSTLPFTRPTEKTDKSLVYYVRKSQMAMNGEGSGENFKEFFEKVTNKNSVLKGYYSHRHLWGSDAREFSEVFVYESLADIEKAQKENQKLVEENWPDKDKRKEFFTEMNKLFTGRHADYVYRSVPELLK